MLEDKSKRKNLIKNIAIVFLSIMLVLTFFSNTFMNYSLVEVSTQMVRSDSITSKVRGNGVVEASDSYSVTIKESRKIATVNVKTGHSVEKGDVLFTLQDVEGEELLAARKELAAAENAYEVAVLNAGISVAERQAIESGKIGSLSDRQNALVNAQNAVDTAQATVDALTAQIDAVKDTTVDTSAEELAKLNANRELEEKAKKESEAEAALSSANTNREQKEDTYQSAKSKYEQVSLEREKAVLGEVKDENNNVYTQADLDAIDARKATAKSAMDNAYSALVEANKAYSSANNSYKEASNATAATKQKIADLQYTIDLKTLSASSDATATNLKQQLTAANTALAVAQAKQSTTKDQIMAQLSLGAEYQTLKELRQNVAKLESEAVDAEVLSPIAGTVTEIMYTAGQTVAKDEPMMMIQPENKAFVLSFTTTAELAKNIKVGDKANILNNWYGNEIDASVYAIKKNPSDRTNVQVVCELSGDVSVGANYTVSIGEKSANYDLVVPTSSIREDANGKFILIIESKNTPLGNRYYARRTNVEVIASDDTYSAIAAPLEGYSTYVITTTSKPVEENQQVRLAE